MARRRLFSWLILFATSAPFASALPYTITSTAPSNLSAGAPSQTLVITGQLPAFSPQTFGVCFYTGFGSTTPVIPATGNQGSVVALPDSSIQQIPPSSFVYGSFSAQIYVVLASAACDGTGALSNKAAVVILAPALENLNLATLPQTNPSVGGATPPTSVTIFGANFVAQTVAQFQYGSAISLGTVISRRTSALQSTIPAPPAGATTVTVKVCNVGTSYTYCSDASTSVPLYALTPTTGTLSASPNPVAPLQLVSLNARFGPATPTTAGALSGTVSFTDGSTTLGAAPLTLDTKTIALAAGAVATINGSSSLVKQFVTDFNKDGLSDVLWMDSFTLHLFSGVAPAGNYAADQPIYIQNGCLDYIDAAVGDLNGDGYPDIVLECSTYNGNKLYAILNQGGTGFAPPVLVDTVFGAHISLGDFNKDGKIDIVLSGPLSATPDGPSGFQLYNGNGDGTFAMGNQVVSTFVSGSTNLTVADFNQDGYPDLAILRLGTNVAIFQNDGTGNFATSPTLELSSGVPSQSFFVVPRAAIHFPDVFFVDLKNHNLTAALNAGTSTTSFQDTEYVTNIPGMRSVVFGDFNADGYLDAAVSDGSTISLYSQEILTGGTTIGQFLVPWPSANVSIAGAVVLATMDQNADGYADLLIFSPPPQNSTYIEGFLTDYITSGAATAILGSLAFTIPGPHTIVASTPGTFTLLGSSAQTTLTVNAPLVPTISWATPASIVYGTALSALQLNATATINGVTIPGTFAYLPAAGTVLTAGLQVLTVTFKPTDTIRYANSSGSTTINITPAIPTIVWPTPAPIVYGTNLSAVQLNATATGVGGVSLPGVFNYAPAAGTLLGAGTQTLSVRFAPTDVTNYQPAAASISITVQKATPSITWPTPANVIAGTKLSSVQLDATANGVNGTTLPGTFIYSPAAGMVLSSGVQTLSVLFTPTDSVDYTTASGATTVTVIPLTLATLSPATAALGDAAKTISLTGTGFATDSVVQVNGASVQTTYGSGTAVTAIVPASYFQSVQVLQITVSDPSLGQSSAALSLPVAAPPVSIVLGGPFTTAPGTQPAITLQLPNPYPVALAGVLTLTFAPISGGIDDPAIQFASGGRTLTFNIPANSTATPTVQIQAGTVAGTITATLLLTAGGVNVTPRTLQPLVIQEPPAVPAVSSATVSVTQSVITVTLHGYSNTREVSQAVFHFTGSSGSSLQNPDITVPVGPLFATWYSSPGSAQYGSTFTYTQNFTLSDDASSIARVAVTVANSVGVSITASTP